MKQIMSGKVNSYYLESKKGNMLIDTGYFCDKDSFLSRLEREGIRIGDISFLLLTHHHDDHCGMVVYLLEQNPAIQLVMHPLCSSFASKGRNTTEYAFWCTGRMKLVINLYEKLNAGRVATYPAFSARKKDLLLDFSHGPVSFHGYTIIPAPGHTPGSIGVLDDRGNLFCGDAAANFLHCTGARYAPPIITDLKEFYGTWQTILSLPVQRIYPGHGKSFRADKLRANLYALQQKDLRPITGA